MTTKRGLPDKPQTEGHLVSGSDGLSFDAAVEHYIDPAAEKRLIVKLDLYLAPVMTLIFLAAYLDRANIGNAASAGMTADLHMTSGQLGNAVTLFYVLYVPRCGVLFCNRFLVLPSFWKASVLYAARCAGNHDRHVLDRSWDLHHLGSELYLVAELSCWVLQARYGCRYESDYWERSWHRGWPSLQETVNGKYLTGLRISIGAVLLAGCGHIVLYTLLRFQNRERYRMTQEEREEEIKNGWGGDFHPDFRYAL
ncbi:hypothetical protein L207DRAFT_633012 [Hyaloscypha variabilis F]|uniref:Uncharacterized protein n=1 Tax=Hyaloscypha variabilis (strain UAMH 11265 / GT02V1 / F) TaxID=1149755 RepID=A0A2J6RT26_HYAVF|nr:hypothetical protein L207DRAFT_633012 [Hyaloscypha variabilis F]